MSAQVSGRLPHQEHCEVDYLPEYLAVDTLPREHTAAEHAHMNEVLGILANVRRPGVLNVHR